MGLNTNDKLIKDSIDYGPAECCGNCEYVHKIDGSDMCLLYNFHILMNMKCKDFSRI